MILSCVIISSVQSLSHVRLFATPRITAHQASLSITNSRSLLKLMSIESVMPSSHLILCRPLLLLPPIPPSIRVFSNESVLCIRWLKDWNFSFSISPSNEYSGLISFRMDWKTPIFFIFIGVWLIYNIVLLSAVQQSDQSYTHTHTHTHIYPLFFRAS